MWSSMVFMRLLQQENLFFTSRKVPNAYHFLNVLFPVLVISYDEYHYHYLLNFRDYYRID